VLPLAFLLAAAPRLKQSESARGVGRGELCMRPPGLRPVWGGEGELYKGPGGEGEL
jgi:hypothetical protein